MHKQTDWLLVADAGKARIFEVDVQREKLVGRVQWELEADVQANRDLQSDRPGRTFDSRGEGRHAKEPATDAHRHNKELFARDIAQVLQAELEAGTYQRLFVAAAPQMLGDLRAVVSTRVAKVVAGETAKDLTNLSPHDLEGHLSDIVGR